MVRDEGRQETIKTSVKLPRKLWKRARMRAVEEELDLQDIIAMALEAYLRRRGGK